MDLVNQFKHIFPMRPLVIKQYFWPESFLINELVQVLTGKPNYPEGSIYEGYKEQDCSGSLSNWLIEQKEERKLENVILAGQCYFLNHFEMQSPAVQLIEHLKQDL